MGRISMPQGKGSQLHNRRDYEKIGRDMPDNINSEKSHENLILVDKDIKEAYKDIFNEVLNEYNARQKRADRKIDDYYEHISKSKNGEKLFYEDVIQWGKKEDFESNPSLRNVAKECLKQYAEEFELRNPNLKLIGAYIHMDEASPHMHIDYIPVAHGYSKGLKMRNSLDKAMKEMGYVPVKESRKNNATKLWKENERGYFGEICMSKGLDVERERKARGSLSVEEYKEAKDKMLQTINIEKEEQQTILNRQSAKIKENQEILMGQKSKYEKSVEILTRKDQEIENKNVILKEKEKILDDLDEALECVGDLGLRVTQKEVPVKMFSNEKRTDTTIEGITIDEVKRVFSLADIVTKAKDLIAEAKRRASRIIAEANKRAEAITREAYEEKSRLEQEIHGLKGMAAKAELDIIKNDRPELFDMSGRYIQRGKNHSKDRSFDKNHPNL